jgi:hypothetical protein
VVSVLATGPKGRGFKPGRSDEYLRAIKVRSMQMEWACHETF